MWFESQLTLLSKPLLQKINQQLLLLQSEWNKNKIIVSLVCANHNVNARKEYRHLRVCVIVQCFEYVLYYLKRRRKKKIPYNSLV